MVLFVPHTPIVRRGTRNRAPGPPPLAAAVRATRPTGTRIRARAAADGGGRRAAGVAHGRAARDPGAVPYKSYGDPDVPNPLNEFRPTHTPSIHFERPLLRNTMTKAIDGFCLFVWDFPHFVKIGELYLSTREITWFLLDP